MSRLATPWSCAICFMACFLSMGRNPSKVNRLADMPDSVRPVTRADAQGRHDVENETATQSALSRPIRNKTVLVIAHRMRTVAGADLVIVLADGVVAERVRTGCLNKHRNHSWRKTNPL